MVEFKSPENLKECMTRSDEEIGGYSTVNLDWDEKEHCAHFHGNLSLDLPARNLDVTRSGYAMFRTNDRPVTSNDVPLYWDFQKLTHIALRVKGDRRKYFVNVQSYTSLPTEIHQHRLYLYNPGQWEVAVIPIRNFLLTNWGLVHEIQQIEQSKVKTVGVGLLDRRYGPYSLHIDWIKAINDNEAEKYIREARIKHEEDKASRTLEDNGEKSDIKEILQVTEDEKKLIEEMDKRRGKIPKQVLDLRRDTNEFFTKSK
ncbi:complex I intermediate-associated protein 30-domain-containing protein [Lipomyces oligophaga]|uniref:complex I intermediate-associated protein 30-domain-containing protein n=1 Tax=Lipomyces oligophaga TaxID=45792 RepID=UPI0034CE6676